MAGPALWGYLELGKNYPSTSFLMWGCGVCSCLACWCTWAALLIHSNNFQRGSKSKSIACISWAPTQGRCLHGSFSAFTSRNGARGGDGCRACGYLMRTMRLRPCFSTVHQETISSPLWCQCERHQVTAVLGTAHEQHELLCSWHELSFPLEKRLSHVSRMLTAQGCRFASTQSVFSGVGIQSAFTLT